VVHEAVCRFLKLRSYKRQDLRVVSCQWRHNA